nr:MAG TPA: hypothetical protein [Caudoviricetes sp.]
MIPAGVSLTRIDGKYAINVLRKLQDGIKSITRRL